MQLRSRSHRVESKYPHLFLLRSSEYSRMSANIAPIWRPSRDRESRSKDLFLLASSTNKNVPFYRTTQGGTPAVFYAGHGNTKSHLRYFDCCGNVLDACGKTGGQQGDPLEIIIFCLTVHHCGAAPSTNTTKTHALRRTLKIASKPSCPSPSRCSRTSSVYSRRTMTSPSISTRPRFSSRVSRRLMRTLPHSAQCRYLRTPVPCSLPRPL